MATVTESVRTLLREGVQALLLASGDGFVIDAAWRPPASFDMDTLAAGAAGIFRAAGLVGRDLGAPKVLTLAITLDGDQTVLGAPIAGEAIGVLVTERGIPHHDARRMLDEIRVPLRRILEVHTGKSLVEAMSRTGAFDPAAGDAAPVQPARIALRDVQVQVLGAVITARVVLSLDHQEAAAKTVGRDTPGQRAVLAGEATIRAMLELLPPGHAVELTHLEATTPAREALWALTRFLSPDSEQSLFGIAPVQDGDEAMAAAKAILNAVNRRIGVLLNAPAL